MTNLRRIVIVGGSMALSASMVAALVGCGTAVVGPEVVVKERLVYPDDAFLVDCLIETPPEPKLYMASSLSEREGLLTKALERQMANTVMCNTRWDKLRRTKMKGITDFAKHKGG